MAHIALEGYEAVVPNEIYTRRQVYGVEHTPIAEASFLSPSPTQVVSLSRFTLPTEDEVINHIQSEAKDYERDEQGLPFPNLSHLRPAYRAILENLTRQLRLTEPHFLDQLTDENIAEIAEGEKDEIDHLRRHYTESSWGEGASLVFLEGATLPVYSEGLFSHSDPQTIRDLTKKYGRDQWGFQIGIKDDRLHPYDEIKDEMERQLHTVGLLRDTRFQDHLNDTVELFYTAIGESEAPIGDIPDESQEHLTNQAKQTVDLYRMCNELRERDDSSPFADLMETLNGLRGMRIIYTDLSSSPEEETQQ